MIVGISNAILGYTVFALLFYSELFPAILRTPLSQAVSYLVGIAWAFVWNRYWAFKQTNSTPETLWSESVKFFVLQVVCLVLSTILVAVFIDHFAMLPEIGWILAMTVVTAVNFLAMHFWVFPVAPKSSEQV